MHVAARLFITEQQMVYQEHLTKLIVDHCCRPFPGFAAKVIISKHFLKVHATFLKFSINLANTYNNIIPVGKNDCEIPVYCIVTCKHFLLGKKKVNKRLQTFLNLISKALLKKKLGTKWCTEF